MVVAKPTSDTYREGHVDINTDPHSKHISTVVDILIATADLPKRKKEGIQQHCIRFGVVLARQ